MLPSNGRDRLCQTIMAQVTNITWRGEAMATGRQIQKKGQANSTVTPKTGLMRSRPFAEPPQPESAPTPEIQTKVESGQTTSYLSRLDLSASPPIQAKLTIGAPGDQYEQEADAIASQVVKQISAPTHDNSTGEAVQRQTQPSISRLTVQRQEAIEGGTASSELENTINQAKGGGAPLAEPIRRQMEGAFSADFSGVRVHTNSTADTLNHSLSARAFTTGNNIFFKQGEYNPGSSSGKQLLAHELTHVVQQGGSQIQAQPTISVRGNSLQTMRIQRAPQNVWIKVDEPNGIKPTDPKKILKEDFYSNWFLAQEYLLDPSKWTKHGKAAKEVQQKSDKFKELMKKLLLLREKETNELLTYVRQQLMKAKQFKGLTEKEVLDWGSAGSQSLTSDIDVNLKGAGSIQAVALFNRYFKTKLHWSLDPGTVYDVNVYAQDFMTPAPGGGKPFDKNQEQNTITPNQEVAELNAPAQTKSDTLTGFDAFALNQDVWSMVKMRIYMSDGEWNTYKQEILQNANGDGSDDAIARQLQIQAQIEDTEHYYQDYKKNIEDKIHEIDHSSNRIYKNMRQTLEKGNRYLSKHQQEASKKMMAANLIYQEKLEIVNQLRQELQAVQKAKPIEVSKIKEVGINLKNALSEAIMYSNEAYFTQGAVHFAVIGQQIGKGKSTLVMSEDEHLHAFREQIGDSLKVLNEYAKESVGKAILKAGKYIDRMAKSAIPLLEDNLLKQIPDYENLKIAGAAAAKLKSDKTQREELTDRLNNSASYKKEKNGEQLKQKDTEDLEKLKNSIPQQQREFDELAKKFNSVADLRAKVIAVGKQIENTFRLKQREKNEQRNAAKAPAKESPSQDDQVNQIQKNIHEAGKELQCFNSNINNLKDDSNPK